MGQEVLTLDKNYEVHQWVSVEDAIILEAKDNVLQHLGEAIYVYRGGVNRSGEESRIATNSIIVVDGVAPYRTHRAPALTNIALFQRDRCICAYCGNRFKPSELTRDHVMPQSRWNWAKRPEGPDQWTNVVTACKGCNSLKDDTLPGQKLPKSLGRPMLGPQGTGYMDPLYVPYTPCRNEHMILRNRHIKEDQMKFLLKRITNEKSRAFDYARDLFGDEILVEV